MWHPGKKEAGLQAHFDCGGCGCGEERSLMSGLCRVADLDFPLEITSSRCF